jgi:hypothetical protein
MSDDCVCPPETPGALADLVGDACQQDLFRGPEPANPPPRRNGRWYLSVDLIAALAEKACAEGA